MIHATSQWQLLFRVCTAPRLATCAAVFILRFSHENGPMILKCTRRGALGEDVRRLMFSSNLEKSHLRSSGANKRILGRLKINQSTI